MSDESRKATPLRELFEGDAFKALPLSLSARLAEGRTPLRELRLLEPGSLISLETPVGEPSQLIAEGAAVCHGEIVEIKGELAFRITRLGR